MRKALIAVGVVVVVVVAIYKLQNGGDRQAEEPKETPELLLEHASDAEFGATGYACEDTVTLARAAGVDYHATVGGCLRRERSAIHTLFRLTVDAGFDAASSQGHAAVLGRLLRRLGDDFFGRALAAEPSATRQAVRGDLYYDFGVGEGVRESWMLEWYPRTFTDSR